jgi:hypothetical protein
MQALAGRPSFAGVGKRRISAQAAQPSRQPRQGSHEAPSEAMQLDFRRIAQVAAIVPIMCTIVVGVQPANAAERVWKPRRHYRRMGETILDTWAEDAVAVRQPAFGRGCGRGDVGGRMELHGGAAACGRAW